jgi:hypothetical protein
MDLAPCTSIYVFYIFVIVASIRLDLLEAESTPFMAKNLNPVKEQFILECGMQYSSSEP